MPELPDVESFRRYFEKHGLNLKIARVDIPDPRVLDEISLNDFEDKVVGRSFKSSGRHGKYLFGVMDRNGAVVFHFGMTGSLQYSAKRGEPPAYTRLILNFSSGEFLAYADPRKLGRVYWTQKREDFIARKGLGPDALAPDLDFGDFVKIIGGRKGEIKSVLMDQHVISGIGNIYSDEILYQAMIHPEKRVSDLGQGDIKKLFARMKKVLRESAEDYAGSGKFPSPYLIPKRKKGSECPRCGTPLEGRPYGGRTAWFCPACQKK